MTLDEQAIKEISEKYGLPVIDIKASIKICMEYQQAHQRIVEMKKAKLVMSSSKLGGNNDS